jgi:hypothetical protein
LFISTAFSHESPQKIAPGTKGLDVGTFGVSLDALRYCNSVG